MTELIKLPRSTRARLGYQVLRAVGVPSGLALRGIADMDRAAPHDREPVLARLLEYSEAVDRLNTRDWLAALGYAPEHCEECGQRVSGRETAGYHPESKRVWCRSCALRGRSMGRTMRLLRETNS